MRMRIAVAVLLALALPMGAIDSFGAAPPTTTPTNDRNASAPYTTKKLSLREEGLEIKGELPVVQNQDVLGLVLNERIETAYRQKIASAKESKARSITFGIEYYSSRGISSIVLKSNTATAVSKEGANSFNFVLGESRVVGVNDVLGANGLQIANKVISQRIRADSERYYTNFPGLQETDAFYVHGEEIVFLFDAFQIAPGSEGIVSFRLKIDNVINSKPVKKGDGYWMKDTSYGLKMVSLRAVCGDLGYNIRWNNSSKVVTVERAGDVTVSFMNANNKYSYHLNANDKDQTKVLESPPVTVDNVTYVPISFFDQILELVTYHVEDNDSIVFSTYYD